VVRLQIFYSCTLTSQGHNRTSFGSHRIGYRCPCEHKTWLGGIHVIPFAFSHVGRRDTSEPKILASLARRTLHDLGVICRCDNSFCL
jgi:hypothetical protein